MIEPTDEDRRNDPSHEQHKLTTEACRYLAFGLVTGQILARASTATVFRGDFYASPEWYGSQKPAIPLEDTSK
jgi:hypothetical protein